MLRFILWVHNFVRGNGQSFEGTRQRSLMGFKWENCKPKQRTTTKLVSLTQISLYVRLRFPLSISLPLYLSLIHNIIDLDIKWNDSNLTFYPSMISIVKIMILKVWKHLQIQQQMVALVWNLANLFVSKRFWETECCKKEDIPAN